MIFIENDNIWDDIICSKIFHDAKCLRLFLRRFCVFFASFLRLFCVCFCVGFGCMFPTSSGDVVRWADIALLGRSASYLAGERIGSDPARELVSDIHILHNMGYRCRRVLPGLEITDPEAARRSGCHTTANMFTTVTENILPVSRRS